MPKPRKSGSSRKPPEPDKSHDPIEEWMQNLVPSLQPLVERVDALIREAHSDLRYAIKWKKAYYGLPDVGWVIEMVAYDVSVNVVFLAGGDFDDPPPLGDSGDSSRYIKLKSEAEADTDEMRQWIRQAGEHAGWEWPS